MRRALIEVTSRGSKLLPLFAALAFGCSDPPAPSTPAAEPPPAIPTPAASGAYFGADDPPASGERMAAPTPAPEALVAQIRPGPAFDLVFTSRDGLAVLDETGDVTLVDLPTGAIRARFSGSAREPLSISGRLLRANSFAADLASGEAWLPLVRGAEDATGWSAMSPRGDRFVAQGFMEHANRVVLADRDGALIVALAHEAGREPTLHWAPSGRRFALCGRDRVELREAEDGALSGGYDGPADVRFEDCAFRPMGGALAVLGSDHAVTFLDAQTLEVRATAAPEGTAQPDRLAWSSDGSYLVAWRRGGGHLVVRDAVRGEVHRMLVTELHARSVAVGAGGRWLVVGTDEGEVVVFDLADGTPRRLREPALDPVVVAMDPTGTRAAFVCEGTISYVDLPLSPVTVSDLRVPALLRLEPFGAPDRAFMFLHDGLGLFRWTEAGLAEVAPDAGYGVPIFTPGDSRWMADGLFDGDDGARRFALADRRIRRASPDGRTFVATRADSEMVFLDEAGHERAPLAFDEIEEPPCHGVGCELPLAFTPDGTRLAMLRNTLLRIFDTATGAVVARREVRERAVPDSLEIDASGTWLRHVGENATLQILSLDRLRTVFSARLPEADGPSYWAFTAGGHAHTEPDALVITALPPRGRPTRVVLADDTESLVAFGDRMLVRETRRRVELRSAETGALLAQLDATAPRLVLAARAAREPADPAGVGGEATESAAIENVAESAELIVADCAHGTLRVRSSTGTSRALGACPSARALMRVGPTHFAVVADDIVRIVRTRDGASLRIDAFSGRDTPTTLIAVDDAAAHLEGTSELELRYLVRAAGPLLTASLTPATGRARSGLSSAVAAP